MLGRAAAGPSLARPLAALLWATREASQGSLAGVLGHTDEQVVSSDLRGEACTAVFDAKAGLQLDPAFV